MYPPASPVWGESPEDPKKTIEEADILQRQGAKLYTLSRSRGLVVIDMSNPDALKTLGSYPLSGQSFKIYKENTVLAMFSRKHYECEGEGEENCKWVTSSRVAALDATDPKNISLQGTFDLPGSPSDFRVVGDVLYAIAQETGACWKCSDKPNTTVSSLSLKNLQNITLIDRVSGGLHRDISVSDKQMFIASVESKDGSTSEGHPTIRVVDISDPGGKMTLGASVDMAGQTESRWQMDEHNGVLRVINLPVTLSTEQPPKVQTFQVESAQKLTPLASIDIKLTERLRSVRFDGDRTFAATVSNSPNIKIPKDPLLTFDLSDPAAPKQLGDLETPGPVYRMEPRGDRLLVLGVDNESNGSPYVSLFDVSDMTKPTMLDRVYFGAWNPDFSSNPYDFFKGLTVLPDEGLILVPFFIWGSLPKDYESGIQLVDYGKDQLVKRGVAPQPGHSYRAFFEGDRLFSISQDKLRTFDISDRDNPVMKDEVVLHNEVRQTMNVGNNVVRLSVNQWTRGAMLDIVPEEDVESPEAPASLDLSAYTEYSPQGGEFGTNIRHSRMLVSGSTLTLVWTDRHVRYNNPSGPTHVLTIDMANPAAPKVLGHLDLPFFMISGGWLEEAGKSPVQVGTTLAIRRSRSVELIDLKDPSKPTHAGTLELPTGEFPTGLGVSDSWLVTSHAEPVPEQPGKIRFFLDRIDVSNPAAPQVLPKINVLGSPLRFDGETGSLVSVDYKKTVTPAAIWEECYGFGAHHDSSYGKWFDSENKACVSISKALRLSIIKNDKAMLLDTLALDADGSRMQQVILAKERLVGVTFSKDAASGVITRRIISVSGFNAGKFYLESLTLEPGLELSPIGFSGERAVLMDFSKGNLFTLDPDTQGGGKLTLRGVVSGAIQEIRIVGDKAIASVGEGGVQVISLK